MKLILGLVTASIIAVPTIASAARHTHHSHVHMARHAPSSMAATPGNNPMTVAPFPSTASDRAPPFGRGSREGSNEVETILGNNPMTKASYPVGNMRVKRVEPIMGPNPASGTP